MTSKLPHSVAMGITLLLWSAAFPAITYALREVRPMELLALRLLGASLLLVWVVRKGGVRFPKGLDWVRLGVAGAVGWFGYNAFLFAGQRTVSPGSAAFITNLAPLIATSLAWLFLKEKPPRTVLFSLTCGLLGVTLIAFGEGRRFSLDPGVGWILLAACCSSSATVMLKPILKRHTPVEVTCYVIWSATLLTVPWWPGVPGAVWHASVGTLMVIGYLCFVLAATAILWNQVIGAIPVARATAATYLIPVMAVIISAATLRVLPTPLALIGGALVLAGQVVAYMVSRRRA